MKKGRAIRWFMKNPDVKLPSRVTESRGSNDVEIYIPPSLLFHLSPSLSPALRSAFLFWIYFQTGFLHLLAKWPAGNSKSPSSQE